MKKTVKILGIAMLILALAGTVLTGCGGQEAEPTPTAEPEVTETPPPEATPAELNIRARFVADEAQEWWQENLPQEMLANISELESYHEFIEFDEPDYPRIIITTEAAVSNFRFLEIQTGGEGTLEFYVESTLYTLDELTPETPFIVTWMNQGTLPHRAITFLDESGTTRYFTIDQSGYDGGLSLNEFEPGTPNVSENGDEGEHAGETPQVSAINIQPLLWSNFEEMRHLFGNQTGTNEGVGKFYTYFFDSGLDIGVDDFIISIFMDYNQVDDRARYHFNGIDGTSTYDDVVAMFGDQPHDIRAGSDEERVGAVEAYGYWIVEGFDFVRFFFAANGSVVAISFFIAD